MAGRLSCCPRGNNKQGRSIVHATLYPSHSVSMPKRSPVVLVQPKAPEQPKYPAPPVKFRCARSRMLLTIRITLHHIGPKQINLNTTPTAIELDTLQAHRKFMLRRGYPRGIECDDSRTVARMEKGALVVEMPITKLPAVPCDGEQDSSSVGPSAPAGAAKHASASMERAGNEPKAKKRALADGPRAPGGREPGEDAPDAGEGGMPVRKKQAKAAGKGGRSTKGSEVDPSDDRVDELIDAAGAAAAEQRDASLAKMRRMEQADEAEREKLRARKAERVEQKRSLVAAFQRQRAAAKADAKAQRRAAHLASRAADDAPEASPAARETEEAKKSAAKSAAKKRRVSFSPESIKSGRTRR